MRDPSVANRGERALIQRARSYAAALSIGLVAMTVFSARPATAVRAPRATKVSAGGDFGCALMRSQRVECWGDNRFGQLGNGSTATHRLRPVLVRNVTRAVAVDAGTYHACALLATGRIKCWGRNTHGELGDRTTKNRRLPVFVRGIVHATRVAAGEYHTCAVLVGGAARCWGSNLSGEIGDGTVRERHVPTAVVGLVHGITWISAGRQSTCAVQRGVAKCWGRNQYGQVGDGTTANRPRPRTVTGLGNHTLVVNAGPGLAGETCALVHVPDHGSALFCWGDNANGQLGDGTIKNRHTPVRVAGMQSRVTSVAIGDGSTCAVRLGGLKCWGRNGHGQLGDGTTTGRRRPRQVVGLGRGADKVALEPMSACALLTSGRVKCWGFARSGQLGNGSGAEHHVPVFVHLI